MNFNSKSFKTMRAIIAFAVTAMTLAGASVALASAPMATSGSPGYYRFHFGDFEITALSDGTFDLPASKLLTGVSPEVLKKGVDKFFLTDPVETSDNAYLINTGSKLVLVDTGAGNLFGPTLGQVVAHLSAAGYKPEQVDAILITHMHPDHVGGLLTNGKMTFPNATIFADKEEAGFWLSAEKLAAAPEANKGFFQGAQASLNPYVKAGKTKWIEGETEIVPGVKSRATHGHTAGHTIYIVESKGKKLFLIGDLIHVAAVQFENLSIRIGFDTDQNMAEAMRKKVFAEIASGKDLFAASHLAFPGLGHIRPEKKGYDFVPMNYIR
jgi:glyoxylase-like metal-dependent hydrolase (beta-lactamase superfamily II)